jgi:hypothetical protein
MNGKFNRDAEAKAFRMDLSPSVAILRDPRSP